MFKFLFLFRAHFGDSRLKEIESLAYISHTDMPISWNWNEEVYAYYGGDIGPDLVQPAPLFLDHSSQTHELTSDQGPDPIRTLPQEWADLAKQSIGCRGLFLILGEGTTRSACKNQARKMATHFSHHIDDSWCVRFLFLGRQGRLHPKERVDRIEDFADIFETLTTHYPVDLVHPKHEFWMVEDYRTLYGVKPTHEQAHRYLLLYKVNPSASSYSGIEVTEKLQLTQRPFINTTTMEAPRSIMMAHLAGATHNTSIVDPFCGSGSLLVAAATLGAKTVGSDIAVDLLSTRPRVIKMPASQGRPDRGKEKVCMYDNFDELQLDHPLLLPGLDIMSPQSASQLIQANQGMLYDAILTDPPYGIREASSESTSEMAHILMDLAQHILVPQGRLVFLCLLDGTIHEVNPVHQHYYEAFYHWGRQYGLTLFSFGLERFNVRQFRATVALIKSDIKP